MNYYSALIVNISFLLAFIPMRDNAILFCVQPNIENLQIIVRDDIITVNNPEINSVISKYNIRKIERWLPHARDNENIGDLYLNKIFRIIIDGSRFDLESLKSDFDLLSSIHSSEYEFIRKPTYTPNDSQYSQQWFLPQINADESWDLWDISEELDPGNKSVLLASVDTGVDWDHPDLIDNIWNNLGEDIDGDGQTIIQSGDTWIFDPDDINFIDDDGNGYIDDFIGWDCSGVSGGEDNNPSPPSGVSNGGTWAHGTHVAGLLSATTDNNTGISSAAFNCSIMCVKVSTGEQDYPYITHGYNGILYASQTGHDTGTYAIINNSWGGLGYSLYEQATIDIAHDDYGAIILAAGGNGGSNWDLNTNEFAHYPSSYDNVVSVCPLGSGDSWNNWATYHHSIDIASPGENIRSTRIGTGYTNWSGSSMATPIVGSVMGLVKSYNPDWTNEQVETMVIETADPIIYSINPQDYLVGKLGKGRVDALASLVVPLFPKIEFADIDMFIQNDDNDILELGETIELSTILLNNPDWGNAFDVYGVLELVDPNDEIHIVQNSTSFGDANAGDALINFEPFIIEFTQDSPYGDIEFILTINSNGGFNNYIENQQSLLFTIPVSEEVFLLGDINQDEIINILDIVQLVNIILGNVPPGSEIDAGDMNNDEIINVLDIILVVNVILNS